MGFLKSLFGPPDMDALKNKQDVRGLVKAARHHDAEVQTRAVQALASLGRIATAALLATAQAEKESERKQAADLLDRLGWKPESPDEQVLYLIARDRWADVATLGNAAMPTLIAGLRDAKWDFTVRALVAAALGFRRNPAAAEVLAEALKDNEVACDRYKQNLRGVAGATHKAPDDWLGFGVVANNALARLGSPAAQQYLRILQGWYIWGELPVDVAHGLGMIGKPAVGPLTEVLRTMRAPAERSQRGMWAAMVLGLGCTGDSGAAPLLRSLTPSDSDSREAVAAALHAAEAPSEALITDLGHRHPGIRLLAAAALGNRREKAAIPGLIRLLDDKAAPPMLLATVGLGKIGGPEARQALIARLRRPEEAIRQITIMALEETRDGAAVEALQPLLSDPSLAIKGLAALAIGSLNAARSAVAAAS